MSPFTFFVLLCLLSFYTLLFVAIRWKFAHLRPEKREEDGIWQDWSELESHSPTVGPRRLGAEKYESIERGR